MDVAEKVLVVTGGGNGIGRQVVFKLLRSGAKVAAVDLRAESLDETEEMAGADDDLATFAVDITDRDAVAELPERVTTALGPVDGIVNVAGIIQPFVPVAELEFDAIDRVIDVNLHGTIHMVKAFLPGLLERPTGHIVLVSSMGGFLPVPGQTIYGATKAAVKLLGEGLYSELLDTEVGVTVVIPGGVATNITGNSGVSAPVSSSDSRIPVTSPDDAAAQIVDGMEDNRLHVYIGTDSRLLNVATRVAPRQAARLIQRQMKSLLD